ncbi:MAG: lysylphosphatidylglycerol synthase transmembrane domain-containing protein, partial [Chloroflexota bacterium]|nr:lysylphosphatidylglycerol synthase transmembrane domain-containing protein [Chloroflexota bacterium]
MTEDYEGKPPALEESPEEGKISLRKRFFNFRTLISFAIAIGLIVFIFNQLDVDFSETWSRINDCNPWYFALAFLCHYLSFPVRAVRWRYLLHHAGIREDQDVAMPSTWGLTQMIVINWFTNSILYARMGDAYRAYLFRGKTGVSFSKTLGTLLAERFLDIIVIVLLTIVSIIWLLLTGGHAWTVFGVVLIAGIILLVVIGAVVGGMGRFGHKLAKYLPKKIKLYYTMFEQGTLSSFGQLPLLILMTVTIWLLEAGRLILVAQALGFNVVEIGIGLLIFAALANALITAIPLTPGGLGLVEPGVAGLLTISLSHASAWSIALIDRSISFLSVIIVGLMVFAYWHVKEAFHKRRSVRANVQ